MVVVAYCFMTSTFVNNSPHSQKQEQKSFKIKTKPNQTKQQTSPHILLLFFLLTGVFEADPSSEMGKTGGKLPSFCLNRIRSHVRVPIQSKPDSVSVKTGERKGGEFDESNGGGKPALGIGRKIMIVVDSTIEAEGALQWALSNTVQNQDMIVLLHLTKPSKKGEGSKETAPRTYELVHSMRNLCQLKRPEVEIEVAVVEGKEKGPVIVEEARKQGASLLVLGQKKKRPTTWRLLMVWAGHRWGGGGDGGGGTVEYCIQNASCMAIAVRRKSKKLGGYLITTKRQKDFWLLA
ncbi:uncharacterized protein LOC111802335 [Cucurbita pepo subsp. pepo]|uniref:uncharacterized protein LOC111802335 n=1 Tax=Cucurbita pepo subsp. pepo TaxID=3664 RepID=UPI000C9D4D6E|nr:uncharacterized protein LOC111802335 [Cucurbita pepo subsp. pepo]